MSRLLFGSFAAVSFLFSGTANAEFYSQLTTPFVKTSVNDPIIGVTNAYTSQNDVALSDPVIGKVYDNFRLANATYVTKINWVGAYSTLSLGLNPTFEINFYQDGVGGAPGPQIGTTLTVAATEAAQTDAGTKLILVVDPESETVHAYQSRKRIEVFDRTETIDCNSAVTNWTLVVSDIFRLYS